MSARQCVIACGVQLSETEDCKWQAMRTGHRPLKRQRPTIAPLTPDEATAQIGQYMAGELKEEPWHAFGLSKAPTVAGSLLCADALRPCTAHIAGVWQQACKHVDDIFTDLGLPCLAGRDLNLKQLYKAVQSFGGFASCVASRSFAKVTTKLGIDKTAMTNASFLLR